MQTKNNPRARCAGFGGNGKNNTPSSLASRTRARLAAGRVIDEIRRIKPADPHAFGAGFGMGGWLNPPGEVTPSEIAQADAAMQAHTPESFYGVACCSWADTLAATLRRPDGSSVVEQAVAFAASLPPRSERLYVLAQVACRLRLDAPIDWPELIAGAAEITSLPHLEAELKSFGRRGLFPPLLGAMVGQIQLAPETCARQLQKGIGNPAAVTRALDGWRLVMEHISGAVDLASGRVLCDAGELVLHYRYSPTPGAGELCLSRRWESGFLSFYPPQESRSPLSGLRIPPIGRRAIATLRRFVASYSGAPMSGELSPHPAAARLCRLIGLEVREGRGHLRSVQQAGGVA
jgi:hypothetical protein